MSSRFRLPASDSVLFVIAVLATTLLFGALYAKMEETLRKWSARDLDRRAGLIWSAIGPDPGTLEQDALLARFESLAQDERLLGILVCRSDGRSLANNALAGTLRCDSPLARAAFAANGSAISGRLATGHVAHLTAYSFGRGASDWLLVVQDRTFIAERRRRMLQLLLAAVALALLTLVFVARHGVRVGSLAVSRSVRDLFDRIQAGGEVPADLPSELRPIAMDVDDALRELRLRREAAQTDGRTGAGRLRRLVADELSRTPLVVLANREPYVHELSDDGRITVRKPPSGLVTGIEPLLRACGGTWIAHGSGNADRATADGSGRIAVPPDHPEYVLRRVWLTEEEYDGYYVGFANEGLWPLCHIAHTRPTFRPADWSAYESANAKFARAVLEERSGDALVLVQDYHFALAPRMVREKAPDAAISLFWHIPWPNWEVIGICPWKEQILEGMLGADIVGFHTRFHCLNFLETVQRYLECRVDLDSMSVEFNRQRTLVREYPISVEWPYPPAPQREAAALRRTLGIPAAAHVAVGVDRADYTKGLVERIHAVETFLEQHPEHRGDFYYVQLAAPSRTRIKRYRDLINDIEEAVIRVNRRFGTDAYRPAILQVRNFSPEEVHVYYAMADSALVTPLHDGMNLVAKEYVASCEDEEGALVVSAFAGAARELEGALVVNPYDAEEVARAIHQAVTMPGEEKRERMRMMRAKIAGHSIYDWSAKLLHDMAEVRKRRARVWPENGAAAEATVQELAARS